ncbi:MAG: LamG domain-containing protein, partial [Bacteroidota bacterium]
TVDCGNVFNDLALPLTLSVWARMETVVGNHTLFMTDYNEAFDAYYGVRIKIIDGSLEAFYGDGTRAGISGRRGARSEPILAAGEWVHLAAVLASPTDLTLYVDGQAVGATTEGYGGALRQSEGTMQFGTGTTNGAIDEAYLYSRALTADEVQVLYGAGR